MLFLKVRKRRATTMKSKFVTGLVYAGLLWSVVPVSAAIESDVILHDGFPQDITDESTPFRFVISGIGTVTPGTAAELIEPGTGTPSDVVVLARGLVFASDDESGSFPPGTPPITNIVLTLVEDGSFQDISSAFGLSAGRLEIQSDVEVVPLPAALPLFASGLAGLGLLGSRRKKAAAG
jgi:hypothetical protein